MQGIRRPLPLRYADAIEDEFHLGTVLLWHDYALNRAARPQAGHDSADCRSADMQFTSKPLPVGPRQSCLCVNPAFKRLQDTIPYVKRQTGWPTSWIARCPVLLIHDSSILPRGSNRATLRARGVCSRIPHLRVFRSISILPGHNAPNNNRVF